MEENTFNKDKTPYLVFACTKCQQFSYVKTSQATKKCLRCGRSHQVKSILGEGEIVYGMTLAVNTVKRNQNQLAFPEFRSQGDFIINSNRINNETNRFSGTSEKCDKEAENTVKFKELLLELSKLYEKFPAYMIEIMAGNYGILGSELSYLIKTFKKQEILVLLEDEDCYYTVSHEK